MAKAIQKIGIVGGNVLAAMLCIEAKKRGIETMLLDSELTSIASDVADKQLVSEITKQSVERLALRTDAVIFTTYTIPIIPQEMLDTFTFLPSNRGIDFVANRVEQLTYATLVGVPTPTFYYSKNKREFLRAIEITNIPCKIYQLYESGHEVITIQSEAELALFEDEMDDAAVEWVVEEIGNYHRTLTISAIKAADKIYTYPIHEEKGLECIETPAAITKTMAQKITRFTKKVLQDVETQGLFTLQFGMKADKSIELIHVTPGTSIGDIATLYSTDLSIYEQVLNLLEGEKLKDGVLVSPHHVTLLEQGDTMYQPEFPYHKYVFDKQTERPIEIYIKRVEDVQK